MSRLSSATRLASRATSELDFLIRRLGSLPTIIIQRLQTHHYRIRTAAAHYLVCQRRRGHSSERHAQPAASCRALSLGGEPAPGRCLNCDWARAGERERERAEVWRRPVGIAHCRRSTRAANRPQSANYETPVTPAREQRTKQTKQPTRRLTICSTFLE